jgi:hypothetical protein
MAALGSTSGGVRNAAGHCLGIGRPLVSKPWSGELKEDDDMPKRLIRASAALLLCLLLPWPAPGALSPDIQKALESSQFVYISSTRKDGSLSRPAEIWFMYHDGAVYVGTRPNSWRVRRIKAGRPDAKIAVGSVDGPSFMATGSLPNEPSIQELLLKEYARKYPQGWETHEQGFRQGFKDGSRVLVKYVPKS